MCQRPHRTRRWCVKCKAVTHWQIDPAINHSRCLICHSDSRFSRKVKKTTKEEPKMNKQYVKDVVDAAMAALRKEYDEKLDAIYQCPDCGSLALKGSDHVCLQGKIPVSDPGMVAAKPKRKTINDYVLEVLPCEPPLIDGPIPEYTTYTAKGITDIVLSEGYHGSPGSIASALSSMAKAKRIMRRAATLTITSTSKANKKFEKEVPGFVFWKAAV